MKKQLLSSMLLCSSLFAYDVGVNLSYDNLSIDQTNSNNIVLGNNTPKYKLSQLLERNKQLLRNQIIQIFNQ